MSVSSVLGKALDFVSGGGGEMMRLREENALLRSQIEARDATIAELRGEIAGEFEARMAALEAENARLRARVAAAEKKARKGHRSAGKFSKDEKKLNPKKPGRKKGHAPASRPKPKPEDVDEVIDAKPLEGCPCCGGELTDVKTTELYQVDLPEIPQPKITLFKGQTGHCARCEKTVSTPRDATQVADPSAVVHTALGPNLIALMALLKDGAGMPFRRIAEFLRGYFGITVSPGGISQALDRLAERLLGEYAVLVRKLRVADIVHVDETGWRINGDTAWLWVFTNREMTVYTIRHSRGADVPLSVLGEDYAGIVVSDCLSTYASLKCLKAKCNAHLLRDLQKLVETKQGDDQRFAVEAMAILRDAFKLKKAKSDMAADLYLTEVFTIIDRMDDLVDDHETRPDKDNLRLGRRIRKYMGEFLHFLVVDDLDPTNNHAERQLRPAIVTRKVSCGSRTISGAIRHSVLTTLIATARQQGTDFAALAVRTLLAPDQPRWPATAPLDSS